MMELGKIQDRTARGLILISILTLFLTSGRQIKQWPNIVHNSPALTKGMNIF